MLNQYSANGFLSALKRIHYGTITVTGPEGRTQTFEGKHTGANANLFIHDWRVISKLLTGGDIALAETYRDGDWDADDPAELFLFCLQNQSILDRYINGSRLGRLISQMSYLLHRNTLHGSKKNIHAHYDLGNDFYALWLDPTMTYSSAIFETPTDSLTNAQYKKYDRILERISPSGRLLEIGCGWGGFAERSIERGDYDIKALTISQAQHEFASHRLGKNAKIALEDYRHQTGRYDQIVSIEMFEAVGEKFWPIYFSKIKSLLENKGKAIIQTITVSDALFNRYRKGGDAIRSLIFPGGMLPSPIRFREESRKAGLRITDEFAFGPNYASTLSHWLKRFDTQTNEITAIGFDQKFIRLWRFYLTFCIAAFTHGRTDVMQWELTHAT